MTPLRIRFTGLCMLVRHRKRKFVSVLLPNATVAKTAIDGATMPPHEARIIYRAEPNAGKVYRYLVPRTLVLPARGAHHDADGRSVSEAPLLSMSAIAPRNPVDWALHDEAFASRIWLLQGGLVGAEYSRLWRVHPRFPDDALPPAPFGVVAAGMVRWDMMLDALPDVPLQPDPAFPHDGPTNLNRTNGDIEIWNVPPGHMPGQGAHAHVVPTCDEDFRWFYELVRDRGGPAGQLPAGGLPIPCHADSGGGHDHGGHDHDVSGDRDSGGRRRDSGGHDAPHEVMPMVPTLHTCLPCGDDCDCESCGDPP